MGVEDDGLAKRQESMDKQIDFLMDKIFEIENDDSLLSIQQAIGETEEQAESLAEAYQIGIDKAEELQRSQEEIRYRKKKELSDRLIDEKLNGPIAPPFVREALKQALMVRTPEGATIVGYAVLEKFYTVFPLVKKNDQKAILEQWQLFLKKVQEEGWSYLEMMAELCRRNRLR